MIDTLRIESPPLESWTVDTLRAHLRTKTEVDNLTGEQLYEFTAGELVTSADHRVRLEIREFRWELPTIWRSFGVRATPEKFQCVPFLIVETSVHKAMMQHNVFGGPENVQESARWLVAELSRALELNLPGGDLWTTARVDAAQVYDLGSWAACHDFLTTMAAAKYPRRITAAYNGESIAFSGTMTYAKIYHKGPEFAKHDRKRLVNHIQGSLIDELQELANCFLRVEIELKAKKLRNDFGPHVTPDRITNEYLNSVFDVELSRIMREGAESMKVVRRNRDVSLRLASVYDARLASVLFGTWMKLAALGDDEVRKTMSRPTFYRQRKQLQDAGVSWFGSDVMIVDSAIPEGFRFQRGSQWHVAGESYDVQKALLPFRVVA